jgi:hypothetical protein
MKPYSIKHVSKCEIMGDDSLTKTPNVMSKTLTAYSLNTYMIKVTVNESSQPILQVVTRSSEAVMSTLNLSAQDAEIYTEDTDFYVVGIPNPTDEYVNSIDPSDNDIYLSISAEIEQINGNTIYLDIYNAYLTAEEGMVSFYQQEKDQICLRKAS